MTAADPDRLVSMVESLVGPLRHVYGVSDKVLMMTLSEPAARQQQADLDRSRRQHDRRRYAGAQLPAPHRHPAPARRQPSLWRRLLPAERLRRHHSQRSRPASMPGSSTAAFPQTFPRFVQNADLAVLRPELFDVCNGNRIDDRQAVPKRLLPAVLALRP